MKPSIGRIVHYVSYGTPGGEYTSQCRAAIVTEVDLVGSKILGGDRIGLCAVNPTGQFFHSLADGGSRYHQGNPDVDGNLLYPGGTWHWPEREEELDG